MPDTPIRLEGDDLEAARIVALHELLHAGSDLIECDFQPERMADLFGALQLVNELGFEPSSPLYGCGIPSGEEFSVQGRELSRCRARRLYDLATEAERIATSSIEDRVKAGFAARYGDLLLQARCERVQGALDVHVLTEAEKAAL